MNLNEKKQIGEMEKILAQLELISSRLAIIENKMVQVEHFERVAMTRMNDVKIMQKRNFDKMMDGFKSIQQAFHMMAGAVYDINEDLSENLGVVLKV